VADLLSEILAVLLNAYNTPWIFLPLVFVYAIAIAVVLPIPVELVLLPPIVQGQWGYLASITIVLAAGKTVGAGVLFLLGLEVEEKIRRYSERYRIAARFVELMERFVGVTRSLGLYVILSIPLAPDTVPLYLYSLFNPEGRTLDRNLFLMANFLAAVNRVAILAFLYLIGVNLFRLV
jgi:membrane protein YqaA with SNARE-associated domain